MPQAAMSALATRKRGPAFGREHNCTFGPPIDRAMTRVEYDVNGGCWLWWGGVNSNGYLEYPMFWSGDKAKGQVRVNRFMYEHFNGPIPEGMVVRHKCDVSLCVNPAHLVLGTHKQNAEDRELRGRSGYRSKETIGVAAVAKHFGESAVAAIPEDRIIRQPGQPPKISRADYHARIWDRAA